MCQWAALIGLGVTEKEKKMWSWEGDILRDYKGSWRREKGGCDHSLLYTCMKSHK